MSILAGRYQLVRKLGAGAQGVTWQVQDLVYPQRDLVMKLARGGGAIGHEFEMLTRLSARHIVPIHDLGFLSHEQLAAIPELTEASGGQSSSSLDSIRWAPDDSQVVSDAVYLTRDLVKGEPVDRYCRMSEADEPQILRLGLQIASALFSAHQAGLVHGDVKPDNVLVSDSAGRPEAWVIDFGLGIEATNAGNTVAGTPHYMAPELWQVLRNGAKPPRDRRPLDVYALGVMLYQLLSGSLPHPGTRVTEVADAHMRAQPVPLHTADARLAAIVLRMLSRAPEERPTVRQVIEALAEIAGTSTRDYIDQQILLPFLGRRETVLDLVESASSGESSLHAVAGELGIGKSRLLDQVRWRLERGGCSIAEVPPPAGPPWSAVRRLGAQLAALKGTRLPSFPERTDEGDQSRVFSRLSRWLNSVTPDEGVVIFWDRCHLASEDAIRWLLHHQQQEAGPPLRWILAGIDGPWCKQISDLSEARLSELGPLEWENVEPWARDFLRSSNAPPSHIARLERAFERCDGHPLLFEEVLAERIDLDDVVSRDESVDFIAAIRRRVESLGEVALMTVACVASAPEGLHHDQVLEVLDGAGADAGTADLDGLVDVGLLRLAGIEPRRWEARWPFVGQLVRERLPAAVIGTLLVWLARVLTASGTEPSELGAVWLAAARTARDLPDGEVQSEIEEALLAGWRESLSDLERAGMWSRALDFLVDLMAVSSRLDVAEAGSRLAEAAIMSGRPLDGLTAIENAASRADAPPGLGLERARLLVAVSRLEEAADALEEMTDGGVPNEGMKPTLRAEWYRRSAELALRQGRYSEAVGYSQDGTALLTEVDGSLVDAAESQVLKARLATVRGAAAAFLGQSDALDHLNTAQHLLLEAGEGGKSAARLHTFRAIAFSRVGDLDEAAEAYRRALEEAERAGLEADLPTYLLNVGTAYHRQGRFGLAREYYARGTRVSSRATRKTTRARLLGNQASIDIELGRIDEARQLLGDARAVLQDAGLPLIEAYVLQLTADADALSNRSEEARRTYGELADFYLERGDRRQAADVLLKSAAVALEGGQAAEAQRQVDLARYEIEAGQFADLQARQNVIRARVLLEQGGLESLTGIELFRQALISSQEAGDHLLILRNARHLLDVLHNEGMTELIGEVTELVNSAWNSVAVGLTRQLRADFLHHLPSLPIEGVASAEPTPSARRSAAAAGHESRGATREPRAQVSRTLSPRDLGLEPQKGEASIQLAGRSIAIRTSPEHTIEKLYRMLALNGRILNEPELSELLPRAMDIALSLSSAERGFLLLRDEQTGRAGEFKVAVSRDVDGESIASPHLKVSLTIAREVAATGELVLTGHATRDDRFDAARSVRDLELTSVLCVPIGWRDEVLGTLYLDHRFRHDVFDGSTARMMAAFADQLALALVNARRIRELQTERAALEAARSQVESLLEEKESLLADLETRCERLSREVEESRAAMSLRFRYDNVVAAAPPMRKVLQLADRVVDNAIPVVILGESGTGKEVIARAIHFNGPRNEHRFVAFNCGAVSENLIESELFGYVKGAFTGAERNKDGLFVAAHKGTLFLDELGEMPLTMQVKLLRTLQEKTVRPVGSTEHRSVDVRIIAATNRDLHQMVEDGTFREDLYYRLAGIEIALPPLRERREDIPLLVRHFLNRVAEEEESVSTDIAPDALELLTRARWKGNVRHLENVVRTGSIMAQGPVIEVEDIAHLVEQARGEGSVSQPSRTRSKRGRRPKATRLDVVEALREAGDDRTRAAEILGVSERTLYRYLARYELH